MEQTIIGAFDNIYRARAAREALLSAGFDEDEIKVQASNDDTTLANSDRVDDDDDDGSFLEGIGNFFSSLFGNEHEHVHHYSETVRRGGAVVAVTVEEAARAATARAALAQSGAFDIEKRAAEWDESQGYATRDTDLPRGSDGHSAAVLPVIEEELEVGKREVDLGAVRVYARTVETPVEESVELRQQHASVRREPVDREATADDLVHLRGGLIEVRETEERPVINKTARVVEEVSIDTVETVDTRTISDSVRHTEVEVERDDAASSTGRSGIHTLGAHSEESWRRHYSSNFGHAGDSYEDYEPAYRYGSSLASDQRYQARDWDDFEPEARSEWNTSYPQSAWDKVKAAVRHGWESIKNLG